MYLYLFEDGQVGQSTHPPTKADQEMIEDGVLQVVCIKNNCFMDYLDRDTEEAIAVSEVVSDENGIYHIGPGYSKGEV